MATPNCRNFNKFLDFKNRYIHIFWINMTNQVMKELSQKKKKVMKEGNIIIIYNKSWA